MKNKQTNKLAPLLLNGEESSPVSFSAIVHSGGEGGRLVANLVDDYEIGYFSDGIARDGEGVTIELFKEYDVTPNPEGRSDGGSILPCGGYEKKIDTMNYFEESVKPFRNENGKLSRKGLKELGTDLALDALMFETE